MKRLPIALFTLLALTLLAAAPGERLYEWWLVQWSDQTVACRILVSHSGPPAPQEVARSCAPETVQAWLDTPPCSAAPACEGLYLHFAGSRNLVWETPPPAFTCQQVWDAPYPEGALPLWLQTPPEAAALNTQQPYALLAGALLRAGLADASNCPAGGLLPSGGASPCGLEQARPQVDLWQNRFDDDILQSARQSQIPAQLLKRMIAQESQFWPGAHTAVPEYGLFQLSDQGADTALLWNRPLYRAFCPQILSRETCAALGYPQLEAGDQAMLRGALTVQADARCPECAGGISLAQAAFSIRLLPHILLANCTQVEQTFLNQIGIPSRDTGASYEDMWRFTLVNYNAGSGCLGRAIAQAWMPGQPLSWESVAAGLPPDCAAAADYVAAITR